MTGAAGYYQSELSYLRELGREFAAAHPDAAKYLAAEGADPDVERLLEGVAFLTGRLRRKLDDEMPDLADALIEGIWPHVLRPVPAMTVVKFTSIVHGRGCVVVPRGTMIDSVPVDGSRCRFSTAYEVRVSPLRVTDVAWGEAATLRVSFTAPEGVSAATCAGDRFRLHVAGESAVARCLHECVCRSRWLEVAPIGSDAVRLPASAIRPVGFDDDDALLPDQHLVPTGMRLAHEFFVFPEKFLFVDIVGLDAIPGLADASGFTLSFALERVPERLPVISAKDFAIGCTPAINLFPADGDPIRLDPGRSVHRVRAMGKDPAHMEVYAIRSVTAAARRGMPPGRYLPGRSPGPASEPWSYQERRSASVDGDGSDVTLSFPEAGDGENGEGGTVSLELTCSNRRLPERLGIGDVRIPAPGTPAGVGFENIGRPRPPCPPTDGRDAHWRLLAHLALTRDPLGDADSLKGLLGLLDVRAGADPLERQRHRRLCEGITSLRRDPMTRILDGVPIRGVSVDLGILEDRFDSTGDLHQFASVIDQVLCRSSGLNTFTRLRVIGSHHRVLMDFPARLGQRILP